MIILPVQPSLAIYRIISDELVDAPEVVDYPSGEQDSLRILAHESGMFYTPTARATQFLGQCGANSSNDYFTIVYVNSILSDRADTVGYAYIHGSNDNPASSYTGSIFLRQGPINQTRNALAHEICHLLTNMGHFGTNYAKSASQEKINSNLMKDRSDSLTGPGSATRIDARQEAMIYQRTGYP